MVYTNHNVNTNLRGRNGPYNLFSNILVFTLDQGSNGKNLRVILIICIIISLYFPRR